MQTITDGWQATRSFSSSFQTTSRQSPSPNRSRLSFHLDRNSRRPPLKETFESEGWRGALQQILHGRNFELFMCAVVLANSVTLGVEQGYRLRKQELGFYQELETIFMSIYITEISLQFAAHGLRCLRSNWVCFEIFLVIVGGVSEWVIIPNFSRTSGERLSSVTLLRTARLLRLARAIRLIVKLREIRLLVLGLAESMNKMLPTMGFGAILLYVLGCICVELVPLAMLDRPELDLTPEVEVLIRENFSSLPWTMFTLLQFLTLDNAVLLYKPLVEADGSLSLFFIMALVLLGVIFMNLITATMISRGIEQAMEEKIARSAVNEARRRGLLANLERAFNEADTDKSGSLSREEVAAIDRDQRHLLQEVFGIDSLVQYYDCLDIDGNGELGIDEFCHGLEGIIVAQVPLEVKRVERICQRTFQAVRELRQAHSKLARSIEHLNPKVEDVSLSTRPNHGRGLSDLDKLQVPQKMPSVKVVDSPSPRTAPVKPQTLVPMDMSLGEGDVDEGLGASATTPATPADPPWVSSLREELLELREVCLFNTRQLLEEASSDLLSRMLHPPAAHAQGGDDAGTATGLRGRGNGREQRGPSQPRGDWMPQRSSSYGSLFDACSLLSLTNASGPISSHGDQRFEELQSPKVASPPPPVTPLPMEMERQSSLDEGGKRTSLRTCLV